MTSNRLREKLAKDLSNFINPESEIYFELLDNVYSEILINRRYSRRYKDYDNEED